MIWRTGDSLPEHVALIRRQIETGLADPSTRMLAGAIVSGNFDSVLDRRSGIEVPAVPFHGRWYRGAKDWAAARQICGMRDYMCEVTAIWNFIVLNLRYTQDQAGEDTYQSLRASLEIGAADCDDMTIAFATLLKAVGFEEIYARIVSMGGETWDHIYAIVVLPNGKRVVLDATEKGKTPGWEYKFSAAKQDFVL
jgi:hypothetical protein